MRTTKLVASLGLVAALAALAIPANGLVLRGGPGRVYSTGSPPLPPTQPPVDVGAVNVGYTTRAFGAPAATVTTPAAGAPVLTTAPAVTGHPAMGTTLSVTHGTWSNAPTSHTYQWDRDGSPISGATTRSYVSTSDDLNHTISAVVTATNANGSTPARGNQSIGPIIVVAPLEGFPPTITGGTTVGSQLWVDRGFWAESYVQAYFHQLGWEGSPPSIFVYQWHRGSLPISGATSNHYTLQSADNGSLIHATVTVTNSAGSTTAQSRSIGPVNTFTLTPNCNGWGSATWEDGCAEAPTPNDYTVQHSDFFTTYATKSGQHYVSDHGCKGEPNCHPPWAVAGVDYPVGPRCQTHDCGFGQPGSATDPTIGANYGNGNPAGCFRATGGPNGIYNVINCTGVTTPEQTLDIAHMDFSADGNATHHALGLTIGRNVKGPCVIHDSYFVFDLGDGSHAPNQTYRSTGSTGYNWSGCSTLTLRNNVFRVRDAKTDTLNAMWNRAADFVFFWIGVGPPGRYNPTRSGDITAKAIIEYNALINCPARCFAVGPMLMQHNYFEGLNMYDNSTSGAHGDGWQTTFYSGKFYPTGNFSCYPCNGLVGGLTEKFDTWLALDYGGSGSSCNACALVNQPYGQVTASVTNGSDIINITSVVAKPEIGSYVYPHGPGTGWNPPRLPSAAPVIGQCPGGAPGDNDACNGQTGKYHLKAPWVSKSCSSCAFALIYNAHVDKQDIENNVFVTNAVHATMSTSDNDWRGQRGNASVQSVMWSGYGTYDEVIVKNNYIDACYAAGDRNQMIAINTTGPPDYHCVPPPYPTAKPSAATFNFGGGGRVQVRGEESGNVSMLNGACFWSWGPQPSC